MVVVVDDAPHRQDRVRRLADDLEGAVLEELLGVAVVDVRVVLHPQFLGQLRALTGSGSLSRSKYASCPYCLSSRSCISSGVGAQAQLVVELLPHVLDALGVRRGEDVEVAVVDGDGLAGQADQPLDVVHRRAVAERPRARERLVAGVLEDHHVEAVGRRLEQVVKELGHQHAVAGQRRRVVGRGEPDAFTAVGAGAADDRVGRPALGVDLLAAVDRELEAALGTDDHFLVAEERFGHRAGGDDEGLGRERFQEQHQHDDEDDGFDDLAEAVGRRRVGRGRLCGRLGALLRRLLAGRLPKAHHWAEDTKQPEEDGRSPSGAAGDNGQAHQTA